MKAKKMTVQNTEMLTDLVNRALPKMSDTGKARHLRKVKDNDETSVVAWYGSKREMEIVEVRIDLNLKARNLSDSWDRTVPDEVEALLAKKFNQIQAAKKGAKTAKANKRLAKKIAKKEVVQETTPVTEAPAAAPAEAPATAPAEAVANPV